MAVTKVHVDTCNWMVISSRWYFGILLIIILKVDNVSAQTNCVISPNITTLTVRGGLERDVEFHCQCMDDNGIITGTRWFHGSTLVSQSGTDRPYSTNTVPSRLIISHPFTNADIGTYTCSPNSTFPAIPSGDTVTLNARTPDTPEPPRTCTIISSLPAVTTPSGLTAVVASGTQNVTLYCICMTDNIAVGPIRWFFNGTEVTRKNKAGNPYSRNNLPSPLIIPLFVFGHDGTYHCKSSPFYPALISKNDSITLTLPVIPPVITKHPMDTVIQLHSNFTNHTLTCEADGASSYNWERQNDVIPSDSTGVNTNTLTLINLQPEDAGNYRCVATNASGSIQSNYAVVTISKSALRVVIQPTDTSAAAPFSAQFNFSIQVYGYLTATWHRNNKNHVPKKAYLTLIPSVNETTSILTIPNVTSEDIGTYCCIVWANSMAVRSHCANLFLADPPSPPVVMTSPIVNLTVNDYNLTMKCLPSKNNFNYKWIKKNDVLPSRAQGVNSSQMIIVNLKPEDSGDYQCVMSNNTGTISSNFYTVNIRVSLPAILEHPNNMSINPDESVTFKCTASGFGVLEIVWKRFKHDMPVTAEVTEETSLNKITSILKITKTAGYYSGQYYCVAKNEFGEVVSHIANLHIQVPKPEMIISPQNVTVLPNQSFIMNCLALSFGLLKGDCWIRRDGILSQTAVKSCIHNILFDPLSERMTKNVYNLAVYNVQPSDEGWYCCVATNKAGSTMDCAWLEIDTRPIISAQPISLAIKVRDLNVIAVSCSAIGKGPIYYQWTKYNSFNNSWISPSRRAVNITSPELKFSVIREKDDGVYRCTVTNDDGSVLSDNATVHVYGPPVIKFISNHTMSPEGDKVNLICSAVNDVDAIHPLQIYWYKGDRLVIPDGKRIILYDEGGRCLNSTLLLDPVNHTDDGVYTCRVFNRNDSFTESKTTLTVQYPPFVSIANESPHMTNVGSLAILYCRATGNPIPRVQWYKDDTTANPISSPFQQTLIIPTDMPHTTVYTCKGTNYIGNIKYTRSANITVIVKVVKPCVLLLDAPVNGKKTSIEGDGITKHIVFSCNPNYVLNGESLATCNNGAWSSSTPTCDKQ